MSETIQSPSVPAHQDFDTWREPLLASLRDCGTQPAPRFVILRYAAALVVFFLTTTIAGILGRLMNAALSNAPAPIQIAGYFLLFAFIVAVLARIRNYFLRQAWQSGARSAEDELKRLGSRRPILYLRSFALDRRLGRPTWMERYLGTRPFANTEQKLTASLKQIGPVIAIGRPGEKLPPLGAARFYVSDDRWQQKVEDVQRVAQLVIWATGVTEGLRWEIGHLIQNTNPRRLIVWAHPHLLGLSASGREAEWTKFRDTLGKAFPKPLPEKLGSARFFVFDADWNPTPVAPRMTDAFTDRQVSALRAALLIQQNGATEAEREALRQTAAHREPTDFGSLIGARSGPVHWPLAGVLLAVMIVAPSIGSLLERLLLMMDGFAVPAPSLIWQVLDGVLTTAALVAAFRFIRSGWLAALAAAAAAALALFVLSGSWLPAEEQSFTGMFMARLGLPFLRDWLLFTCLAWTVRRWSRLATALWGGAFIAAVVSVWLSQLQQTFDFGISDFSWSALPEVFGMTLERLITTFPRWLLVPLARATLFAGVYISLLKIIGLLRLDEQSTPQASNPTA